MVRRFRGHGQAGGAPVRPSRRTGQRDPERRGSSHFGNRAAAWAALRAAIGVGPDVPVALFEDGLDTAGGADRLPGLALEFARRSGGG